jgi:diguanylate cyclase (GGDEF)-like protein
MTVLIVVTIYLASLPDLYGLFLLVMTLVYMAATLPKFYNLSVVAINDIELRIRLRYEMEEHIRLKEENKQLSLRDDLTGMPNRRNIEETAAYLIASALRSNKSVGVLFIDLNKFKLVNDTYGHAVGDCLLKSVAERLSGLLRDSDMAGRIGGDEFCVVVQGINVVDDLIIVSDNIRKLLAMPVECNELSLSVDVSIGFSMCPNDGGTFEQLLTVADQRMYEEKANW